MRLEATLSKDGSQKHKGHEQSLADLSNPVINYYRHRVRMDLPSFYRFAIQTGSVNLREILAKVSNSEALGLDDLVEIIEQEIFKEGSPEMLSHLRETFQPAVLLTLGDFLANTARNDLDTCAALKIYEFTYAVFGDEPFTSANILQYVEGLHELGYYAEAERAARKYEISRFAPLQEELLNLQRVRQTASLTDWLTALNGLYSQLGMTQVQLLNDETVPLMDRLTTDNSSTLEGPLVSIIMPTFSPSAGLRTAVRGLLDQTWRNLEILIVDDASPSDYHWLFEEVSEYDPRIRMIRHEQNLGAYVARNTGLTHATGEFITVHDDDDWSHPDKIALQVQVMVGDPSVLATTSGHIRTTSDLALRRVNAKAQFLQMNYSSLMFRRAVVDKIGEWDTVNRGGDSEFYSRLGFFAGPAGIVELLDKPLSFSRVWDGSLTSGEMSRGYFGYSRLLYRMAFRQWQRRASETEGGAIRPSDSPRPYAIPTSFEAGKRGASLGQFDVIFVTDFFQQSKTAHKVVNEIETLAQTDLRIGYTHLYSPETRRSTNFHERLFQLQLEGKVTQVGHDDEAETRLLMVYDLSIGMFADQIRSKIEADRSVVVDVSAVTLLGDQRRSPRSVLQSLKNLDRSFQTTFELVGAAPQDQEELRQSVPLGRLLPDDMIWPPHLRGQVATIIPPQGKPLVGFHSDSNHYRWPNTVEQFQRIYLSEDFTTQFYGQVQQPLKRFGPEINERVNLVDMSERSEDEFLASIDFWVYYPHKRLLETIWEPVLAAFQAGKVVILSPHLEPVYGEAAVYAEPERVAETILELALDREQYTAHAAQGQRFFQRAYTAAHLKKRIAALLETISPDQGVSAPPA